MASPYYYNSKCHHLIFLVLLLLKNAVIAQSEPNFFYTVCGENGNYTQNSLYQKNLNQVFSDLTEQASSNDFYNTTIGESPDTVYGTFYCRRDINQELCHSCVKEAVKMIEKNCTSQKEAIVWYQECTLRYANKQIIGIEKEEDYLWGWGTSLENVSNPDKFKEVLLSTMNSLIENATSDDNYYPGYATGDASFQSYQRVYCLVQCSPDILGLPCERCLRRIYNKMQDCCFGGSSWVMIFRSNCQMRYDMVNFYTPLLAPPSSSAEKGSEKTNAKMIISIVIPVVAIFAILVGLGICFKKKRAKKYDATIQSDEDLKTLESLQYDLATLQSATNSFSAKNKLGEGGFGGVYKGTLEDGRQVAVKRLSKGSGQGLVELQNEVLLLAKLQHRNLVRLLGFCLEREEMLLVYEYVPNKSLDYFLFDLENRGQLEWGRRYKIIGGIARGMLYLHEDSQPKIIHRDLKAGNVLLDVDMNSKVADFGMARIFDVDQTQASTRRIVGTYGYMSPEYAMHGQFSTKSDVYSFGVLVLEIISGRKNSTFYQLEQAEDLLSFAWKQWRNDKAMDFVDPAIKDNCSSHEVLRCMHVGLLCVQEAMDNRPTMETVVRMLEIKSVSLHAPQQPGFFINKSSIGESSLSTGVNSDQTTSKSVNDVTVTQIDASNYGDNIKSAVTALASDASTSHYSNHTTGIGEDRVNAFYYCRYDISLEICQKCVESTAKYITQCYDSLISYEECTLYYSNRSISSVVENLESIYTLDFGNFNAENEVHFSRYMENLVTRLSTNVTSEFEVSKRYFATASSKYSSSETVYALAQCNPDLTSSRCKSCLGNGFADFTYNYTSDVYGQFFFPGCRLSYILSTEETPSRPWKFAQMYDDQYGATSISTGIRRASSTMGLVIASISSVALCLKLFL